MSRARASLCVATALAGMTLALSGCGGTGASASGLTEGVGQARAVQAVSALQQSLITASTIAADSGTSGGAALASELQARDPSNRYTTAPPTQPGIIQVVGGGGGALMLVSSASGPGGGPAYVAARQEGSSTLWYGSDQPPVYASSGPPSQAGWSQLPPP